jgi:hypothetical protein
VVFFRWLSAAVARNAKVYHIHNDRAMGRSLSGLHTDLIDLPIVAVGALIIAMLSNFMVQRGFM